MLCGGAVLLVAGLGAGELGDVRADRLQTDSMLAFGYLVVFGSLVAYTAYVWLLQNAPVSQVATYAYVNPVVAVLLGWALAGEAMTPRTLAAAAIIISSVVVVTSGRAQNRRQRTSSPTPRGPGQPLAQEAGAAK
jgi:drug/metabolite transporter (DMT)-like permease